MDIFSHAVLPLAVTWLLLRRPLPERLAAGLGAAMPDMDVLGAWLAGLSDPLYFMTHRGVSHSLLGAPLFAAAGLLVVTRPWWSRRWPRMAAFRLTPMALVFAVLGALSHLVLDMLTITGVPLLWPASLERYTANVYFFSALYTAAVSGYLVWRMVRGTLTERVFRRGVAVVVVLLLVGGGLRLATLPRDVAVGAVVQPTFFDVQWQVATPVAGGWEVEDRGPLGHARTVWLGNATAAAAEAIALAQATGKYTSWRWVHPAPVVNTTALEAGWRVEFRDAFPLHRNATNAFIGRLGLTAEPLVFEVVDGRARVVEEPGFWEHRD